MNPHNTNQQPRYKVLIKKQKLFIRGTEPTEDKLAISSLVPAVGYKLATREDNGVCRGGGDRMHFGI
jgi:hypothetical protein